MNDPNDLFFYFLRKGLFQQDEKYSGNQPDQKEWNRIFERAYQQAVSGFITDGVAFSGILPESSFWEQKIIDQLKLEERNRSITECGEKWLKRLEHSGIHAFIFKGSSVGNWYQEPRHRETGDIDIVIRERWERLEPLFLMNKVKYHQEHGDLVLQDGPISIEFHKHWEHIYQPHANARLQKICSQTDEKNQELYLVCLILHLRRHFLTYGIGLKQICDIAVMLRNRNMDRLKLATLLLELNAERFSRLLFGFIECFLKGNLDFPLSPICSGKNFRTFCDVILKEGYTLKKEQEKKANQSNGSGIRILKNAVFWIRRSIKLYHLMPEEAKWFLIYMFRRRTQKLHLFAGKNET